MKRQGVNFNQEDLANEGFKMQQQKMTAENVEIYKREVIRRVKENDMPECVVCLD